jgi:hypothetical protein
MFRHRRFCERKCMLLHKAARVYACKVCGGPCNKGREFCSFDCLFPKRHDQAKCRHCGGACRDRRMTFCSQKCKAAGTATAVDVHGVSLSRFELAAMLGVSASAVYHRIQTGLPVMGPYRKSRKKTKAAGG